jgi:hypothetical protein
MDNHKNRKLLKSIRRTLGCHVENNNWRHSSREELEGMCGISSYLLFKTFKRLGYKPTFCMNYQHCFLMVNDNYIDLTLTQFNRRYPQISIRRKPYKYHSIEDSAKTEREIKMLFEPWPDTQNPFKQRLPKIVIDK